MVRTRRTATNQSDAAEDFLLPREEVVRSVQDSIANAVDRQKRNTDKHGRANVLLFNVGYLFPMSTVNLAKHVLTNVGSSNLLPNYIGPFRVLYHKGNAYTIELPRKMRTHPTFYVGRPGPNHQHEVSSSGACNRHAQEPPRDSFGPETPSQSVSGERHSGDKSQPLRRESLDASARSPVGRKRTSIGRPIDKDGCIAPMLQKETLLPLLFGAITQIV